MAYFLLIVLNDEMIIRICRKEASERLNINNTVQAERSAVTDSQHLGCVSERRDLAYVPIADNHNDKKN